MLNILNVVFIYSVDHPAQSLCGGPILQLHVSSKGSPSQCVTVPEMLNETDTDSFFRYQIFSIPIPVLFSVPNFSDTGSDTIKKRDKFPGTGIPGTGTSHSEVECHECGIPCGTRSSYLRHLGSKHFPEEMSRYFGFKLTGSQITKGLDCPKCTQICQGTYDDAD